MSTTTALTIEISTGEEIDAYGKCAVVVYDGTDPVWTSEQVDCTDLVDEVSGQLDWRYEARLAEARKAAEAEVERRVGEPVEWTEIHEEAGFGGEAVAEATVLMAMSTEIPTYGPGTGAAELDDAMREARETAGSIRYWDATSDPSAPGWVLRTYDADGDYDEVID